jgi:hypothetical protein
VVTHPNQANTMLCFVGFEVLTAVAMKVAIFWDIAPCSEYMKQRFCGKVNRHHKGGK